MKRGRSLTWGKRRMKGRESRTIDVTTNQQATRGEDNATIALLLGPSPTRPDTTQ